MREAFVCDGVRTPIGRFGGTLAKVRTDDLAAVPLKALKARNAKVDWNGLDDVFMGCANRAGEDNRNVARAWRRCSRVCQPACRERLSIACVRPVLKRLGQWHVPSARARWRWPLPAASKACRGHCSLWPGQRKRSSASSDFRHDHRSAPGQPTDEAAICHRLRAGDRRECHRRVSGIARRSGHPCAAFPATGRQGVGFRFLQARDRRRRGAGRSRQDCDRRSGRTSAAQHDSRRPNQAQDAIPYARHGHGRQRLGHRRWGSGGRCREGECSERARTGAARPHPWHGGGGCGASDHGDRTGTVH